MSGKKGPGGRQVRLFPRSPRTHDAHARSPRRSFHGVGGGARHPSNRSPPHPSIDGFSQRAGEGPVKIDRHRRITNQLRCSRSAIRSLQMLPRTAFGARCLYLRDHGAEGPHTDETQHDFPRPKLSVSSRLPPGRRSRSPDCDSTGREKNGNPDHQAQTSIAGAALRRIPCETPDPRSGGSR